MIIAMLRLTARGCGGGRGGGEKKKGGMEDCHKQ